MLDRSNMRSEDVKVQLSARKQFEVKSPDCLLKGVAIADYDPKSQEVCLQIPELIAASPSLIFPSDQAQCMKENA